MKKSLLVLFALIIAINFNTKAHDFSAVNSGATIYYKITSANTVSVTYAGISPMDFQNEYTGNIIIPNSVQYNSNNYNITAIDSSAFYNCFGLTSITIPNSITIIPYLSFAGCTGLTSVTLPNSLISIDDHAFSGCNSLTSITLPNTLTTIGISAFSGCNSITSIIIPNSVTTIGNSAFSACAGLTSITLSNTLTSIGDNTFINCHGLLSVIVPNSVSSIGDHAFASCIGLTSITIPNSVTSIGDYAFNYCSALTSIIIPNSITSIGDYTFSSCSGLTSIIIPNTVTSIGYAAFNSCSGLSSIIIPNSVTSIGDNAFNNCSGFSTITIPSSVTSIGNYAFTGCGLSSIVSEAILPPSLQSNSLFGINKSIPVYIPCNSITNYQSATYWSQFTNYNEIRTPQYIDTSICQGSFYTDYGANLDTAGIYSFIDGCDSIILNLSIIPSVITNFYDTVCKGVQYNNYDFNFISDTNGIYTRTLQATNTCDSIVTLNLVVNPTPNIPESLSINTIDDYLEISWQGNGDTYEIYRNENLLANITQTSYNDTTVESNNNYCYKVKAINGDCESDFSDTICYNYSSIEKISNKIITINLYPNPSNGTTKLEIKGLKSEANVLVCDMIGRIIQTHRINKEKDELNIDLSGHATGIYSISIYNDNINHTKKLIVK